ncbi:Fic family protein [Legionella impletisoli]|uniref:Cell division protein Fic n=1 Tax=Legionella impletisoli TaxID=343510 RepID=A0A917JUI1_9GAMM|nr:Fic family protein [Legionella impletisoli]GGI87682.1 cell division protein Fic [Legionella impletisoli]
MAWNWQLKNWPNFTWDKDSLEKYEHEFILSAGVIIGSSEHISNEDKQELFVQLLSSEAVDTSLIEGEHLNRDSVQSSIKKELGLSVDGKKSTPAERSIAMMMVDLYRTIDEPLTHEKLCHWHRLLMKHDHRIEVVGAYRTHEEPMEIVSGPDYAKKVHFVAPPSKTVPDEMSRLIKWFEDTSPNGNNPLPSLTRAGIAHLWFESIHPFEDGNGRIGRGIAEKILSQGYPNIMMTVLAKTLLQKRKEYYDQLGKASITLDINDWLLWFAEIVLEAQQNTNSWVHWIIEKARFMRKAQGQINERQEKVVLRLFRAGPDGFIGGLSAKNYMSITGTTIATTTRDLRDLVEKNLLRKTGERKSTRYYLNISMPGKQI